MVLGAGRGTRLASMGLTVPKVLVDIGDVPLLGRQVDYLGRHGVGRVVVNAHHLADAIEDFARQYRGAVEVVVVREAHLLGTAGGVRNALGELGDGPFFVLYGDVVVDEPLGPIAEAHAASGAAATVTVYETDDVEGKGTVVVDAHDRVTRFAEKEPDTPVPALVNAGLYVIEPRLLAGLEPGVEADFGHDVFPAALAAGERLMVHRLAEPVIDVGTPEGLALARARAADSLQ
jgi:NDP-sugar pyrophosphorylase family protein